MFGGILLIVALVANFVMHKTGRQTMCQWFREHVPKPLAWLFLGGLFGWLGQHVIRGYPAKS